MDTRDRRRPDAAPPPPDEPAAEAPRDEGVRPRCDVCEHFGFGDIVFGEVFIIALRGPCVLLSKTTGLRVVKLGHEVCDGFVRRPGAEPFDVF